MNAFYPAMNGAEPNNLPSILLSLHNSSPNVFAEHGWIILHPVWSMSARRDQERGRTGASLLSAPKNELHMLAKQASKKMRYAVVPTLSVLVCMTTAPKEPSRWTEYIHIDKCRMDGRVCVGGKKVCFVLREGMVRRWPSSQQ